LAWETLNTAKFNNDIIVFRKRRRIWLGNSKYSQIYQKYYCFQKTEKYLHGETPNTAKFNNNIIVFGKRRRIWMGKLQIQPNLIIILLFSENGDIVEWGNSKYSQIY